MIPRHLREPLWHDHIVEVRLSSFATDHRDGICVVTLAIFQDPPAVLPVRPTLICRFRFRQRNFFRSHCCCISTLKPLPGGSCVPEQRWLFVSDRFMRLSLVWTRILQARSSILRVSRPVPLRSCRFSPMCAG